MSRKNESLGTPPSAMSEGGPWGTKDEDAPIRPDGEGPRSPWTPPHLKPGFVAGRGPSAFDELMHRARGSFGGNMPGRPVQTHVWLFVAAVLVILWLGLTCLHSIGETQRGLVSQLGSYTRTLEPGMNLTLPAPLETVRIVETGELHNVSIGATGSGENLVLTGDQDLFNLAYSVNWIVSDPRQFAFQLAEPALVVRQLAQSAMRAVIANVRSGDAAAWDHKMIELQVQSRMQTVLDGYGAGIHIQDVTINKAEPPHEVADAVKGVDAAQRARGEALVQARAYAAQKGANAQIEAAAFDDVYAQYKIAPEITKRRLYYETMEAVLKDANKTVIAANGATPTIQLPRAAGVPREATPAGGAGK